MTKRQFKKLLQHIKLNGGATLNSDGVYMYFNTGFVVSLEGYEKRTKKLTLKLVNYYLQLAHSIGAYMGLWLDSDGFICLDLSEHVIDLKTAIMLGVARKQDAIYNCATGDCIACK